MRKQKTKKDIDMQNGSLWSGIFLFAITLALTGILQQLFNAADIAIVGRFAADGTKAMAAVGSTSQIIQLLVNLFVGISLGTNVVLATALGRKDEKAAKACVHTSILIALVGGVLLLILGEAIAAASLRWMDVPEEIYDQALVYLRIYMAGMPVLMLYNFEAAIYRSQGNTRTPLEILTLSGVINVVLNLFFVCVLHLDVAGVAAATVISNLVSAVLLFIGLCRTEAETRIEISKLKPEKRSLSLILRIGVPSGIQGMMFCIANVIIQVAINGLGTNVIAASSAALNLEIFVFYIISSFGQACTTFTGQNYGAGKPDRCRKTLGVCIVLDLVLTIGCCAVVLIFGRQLLGIFTADEAVIEIGMTRLKIVFAAYGFSVLQEIFSGYLRGFGISMTTALIALLCICGTRIVWIYTVFEMYPTFDIIMKVYPLSLGLTALMFGIAVAVIRPSKNKIRPGISAS